MPIYEYECKDCKQRFDRMQSFNDEPVRICPNCGGATRRVLHPVGVVFKGSGWYSTDSRKSNNGASSASGRSSDSGGESSGSGSGESSNSGSSNSGSGESSSDSGKESKSSSTEHKAKSSDGGKSE